MFGDRVTAKGVLLASMMLAVVACQAGWESWLKPSLYSATCEEYESGEALSNEKGVEGGSWGIIPSGTASAASERGYGQYMKFSAAEDDLVFTPYATGDRLLKSLQISMLLPGYDEMPDVPDTARAAFAIRAAEAGVTNFVGWTLSGWQDLGESTMTPVPDQWYDLSMKFMQRSDGSVWVQYRLKRQSDGVFVALHDPDDETAIWFPAGNGASDAIISKIEFLGDGAFRSINGSEPRRGMLISLVPWREMFIDESIDRHGSGVWRVFDYDTETWLERPALSYAGDAYSIDVPDGEHYVGFLPQKQSSDGKEVVELEVCFTAPNDNDATPDDACALVRIVELPITDFTKSDVDYQFAYMANGQWHTNQNTSIKADINVDYTVEISLDKKQQTASYRVKKGRGAEADAYQSIASNVPVAIGDPLFTFFGGLGTVYSIKSSGQD